MICVVGSHIYKPRESFKNSPLSGNQLLTIKSELYSKYVFLLKHFVKHTLKIKVERIQREAIFMSHFFKTNLKKVHSDSRKCTAASFNANLVHVSIASPITIQFLSKQSCSLLS